MITVGDPIPNLALEVRDANGALANGGAVTLTITLPDGTTTSPAVSNTGTGLYSAAYTAAQLGEHGVSWLVTGANACALTDSFDVESPAVGLVSLTETKAFLRITRPDDDEALQSIILMASDIAESAEGTGKVWRRTVVTNEIHDGGGDSITTNLRPVQSLTSISIDGVGGSVADYDVSKWRIRSPYSTFGTGDRGGSVSISYVAGARVVPAGLRIGVLEHIRWLYGMHRGGTNLPRQGEPDYRTDNFGYLIPNRVASSYRAYKDTGLG